MGWLKRFGELLEDWRCQLQRDGAKAILLLLWKEVLQLPYRRMGFVVFGYSLTNPLPEVKSRAVVEIRPFTAGDLDFVRREHLPSEANLCAQHMAHGHQGFVAFIEGKMAGYAWMSNDATLERVALRFEPGDILVSDAFTAPASRGKGVQAILTQARLQWAQEHGYRRVLAYIEIHNAPSLKVWREKMNAEIIAHIVFTRIGFWRRTKYAA
jgi:GNAT superfamily N-acetyltransferase